MENAIEFDKFTIVYWPIQSNSLGCVNNIYRLGSKKIKLDKHTALDCWSERKINKGPKLLELVLNIDRIE